MISLSTFRKIALSFPGVEELPHFQKFSFRINKKIFATLDEKDKRICVKFSDIDQSVFCTYDKSVIYPVPGKWGSVGWTFIELNKIRKQMLEDALTTAYQQVFRKVAPQATKH